MEVPFVAGEIHELATSFNDMAEALQECREDAVMQRLLRALSNAELRQYEIAEELGERPSAAHEDDGRGFDRDAVRELEEPSKDPGDNRL